MSLGANCVASGKQTKLFHLVVVVVVIVILFVSAAPTAEKSPPARPFLTSLFPILCVVQVCLRLSLLCRRNTKVV